MTSKEQLKKTIKHISKSNNNIVRICFDTSVYKISETEINKLAEQLAQSDKCGIMEDYYRNDKYIVRFTVETVKQIIATNSNVVIDTYRLDKYIELIELDRSPLLNLFKWIFDKKGFYACMLKYSEASENYDIIVIKKSE